MAIPPSSGSPANPEVNEQLLASALRTLGTDLLALQEVDCNQPRSQMVNQVQSMATMMDSKHWAFAPTIIGTPGEKWRALSSQDLPLIVNSSSEADSCTQSMYGIGLISQIPVTRWHHLNLGKSPIGMPLAVPKIHKRGRRKGEEGIGIGYVPDEPRVAIIAELENGFTVAVTHLSFAPLVNFFQLKKLERYLLRLPGIPLIMGDLNLPWNLPTRSGWKSLVSKVTYPSWNPKIQFDYILTSRRGRDLITAKEIAMPPVGISDHLPIGVEIKPIQSK